MRKLNKTTGITFLLTLLLFSFACDKEVSVSPPDPPVTTGYIYIDSNPRGADIYLNSRNTGRHTPDSLKWLEGTDYTVTLKYPLYRDTVFTIRIDEKVRQEIFVDYTNNPLMYGKIQCESDPKNATIYMDGQNTGKVTPYILGHISPGSHQIAYSFPGCRDDSIKITVESDKTKWAYVKLKDTTVWVNYNTSNSGIPTNALTSILIDQNDVKWIGTFGNGIIKFDGRNWQSYNSGNSPLPNNFITAMAFDKNMHLWIGTNKGLAELNGDNWTIYNKTNSMLPEDYINAICVGRNNVIWVGTEKGLVQIDGTNWKLFNTGNSPLPNNSIQSLATELNGKLWMGVLAKGLATYDGQVWGTFTKESAGLPGRNTTALAVGQFSEGVWAGFVCTLPRGADEGGLAVRDNGTWINNYYSKLPSRIIKSIMIKDNIKWVCTEAGLIKFFTPSRWDVLNTANTQLPTNNISAISQDSHSWMWIATETAGLVKYKAR